MSTSGKALGAVARVAGVYEVVGVLFSGRDKRCFSELKDTTGSESWAMNTAAKFFNPCPVRHSLPPIHPIHSIQTANSELVSKYRHF